MSLSQHGVGGNGEIPVMGAAGQIGTTERPNCVTPALLIGRVGTVGHVNKCSEPVWASDNVIVATPRAGLDLNFAYYCLISVSLHDYASETAQPLLTAGAVGNIRIILPPLEDQRRIADFLDAETRILDEVRGARQQMMELLGLKRGRLVDELVSGGQDVSTFVPLKYLVSSVSVGIVITPAAWYVEAGGVPALRGLNVKPGKIEVSDLVQISHEGHLLHRKSRLVAGDLVVVRTGQAGAAAVVPPELDGINCIDLVIVRPGNALIPKFAEYLLNSSYAKRRVSEFSVGSIQAHFNVAAMKAMPIPKYSVIEQKRRVAAIEEVVQPIEQAMIRMREQDRLLAERRQALITAAVTGQIDVTTARGVD
jgi:type I restriction enzyme S subunit